MHVESFLGLTPRVSAAEPVEDYERGTWQQLPRPPLIPITTTTTHHVLHHVLLYLKGLLMHLLLLCKYSIFDLLPVLVIISIHLLVHHCHLEE